MRIKIKSFLQQCLATLLPYQCILCTQPSQTQLDLCANCFKDLPRIRQACQRCGLPLSHANLSCGMCLKSPPPYDYLCAPFHYQQPISYIISALKFRQKLNHAQLLGQILARELQQRINILPELIIPVPLHQQRLLERGYNQALEMAKPISHLLKIPIDYNSCIRTKATQAQTGLSCSERLQNIKNAFHLAHDFDATRIAILDDVVTTTSTVSELCKVLRSYGIQHIQIWCCARTRLK